MIIAIGTSWINALVANVKWCSHKPCVLCFIVVVAVAAVAAAVAAAAVFFFSSLLLVSSLYVDWPSDWPGICVSVLRVCMYVFFCMHVWLFRLCDCISNDAFAHKSLSHSFEFCATKAFQQLLLNIRNTYTSIKYGCITHACEYVLLYRMCAPVFVSARSLQHSRVCVWVYLCTICYSHCLALALAGVALPSIFRSALFCVVHTHTRVCLCLRFTRMEIHLYIE